MQPCIIETEIRVYLESLSESIFGKGVNKMKRRISLIACIALCLVIALSACNGGAQSTTSPSSEPDSVNVSPTGASMEESTSEGLEETTNEEDVSQEIPGEETTDTDPIEEEDEIPNDISADGRIAQRHFNIFTGNEYTMIANVIIDDIETSVETYLKNEMFSSIIESDGEIVRVVMRDEKVYVISNAERTVMVLPLDMGSLFEMARVETDDMIYVGSGSAEFQGRILLFDEYTDESGSIMQFYVDGNNLAGIRFLAGDYESEKVDMVIVELSDNAPDEVFEIPDDYEVMDFS